MDELIHKEKAIWALRDLLTSLSKKGKIEQAKGVQKAIKVLAKEDAKLQITDLERLLASEEKTDTEKDWDYVVISFKASGMSYVTLSEMTGISKSALQRYITGGTKKVPLQAMAKIEEALKKAGYYFEADLD